jgi:hypothetical protein
MKRFNLALLALLTACVLSNADVYAQQKGGKVYWMSTVTVPLGRMQDYHAFAAKELIPEQEKNGYHFVAGWQTIIGDIEEVVVVAEFDNMDAYYAARASLLGSAEWKAMGAKLDSFMRGIHTRMLIALPYIKMK